MVRFRTILVCAVIDKIISSCGLDAKESVQIFYYAWFGTPSVDGKWMHWNHEVLPHWDLSTKSKFPSGRMYDPPEEVGAVSFPSRGLYSSKDPAVLKAQFTEIASAGVGVVILSWWRKGWGSEQVIC